jgi:hypothetical protein
LFFFVGFFVADLLIYFIYITEKRAEDEEKIKEILNAIGKNDITPAYTRRLKSKDTSKPGPILVELKNDAIRNPLLLAAKKLRERKV